MKTLILLACFCGALPALAQGEELVEILGRLDRNCQKVSTTTYRSADLVQPGSGRVFFVKGTLQRRPRPESRLIDRTCFPIKAETTAVFLGIGDRRAQLIPLFRHRSTVAFKHVRPLTFSPDGRFLLLQVAASNGLDLRTEPDVIDTRRGFLPLHLDVCAGATFGATFVGFVDNDRAEFRCIAGDRTVREVWNLSERSKVLVE